MVKEIIQHLILKSVSPEKAAAWAHLVSQSYVVHKTIIIELRNYD